MTAKKKINIFNKNGCIDYMLLTFDIMLSMSYMPNQA